MEIIVSLKEKKVFIKKDKNREICISVSGSENVVIKLPEGTNINLDSLLKNIFERK